MDLKGNILNDEIICTSMVVNSRIYLPNFVNVNENEKLVLMANDENSLFITSLDAVNERINTLINNEREGYIYVNNNPIENIYSSILDIPICKNDEKGFYFEYNDILESFLDDNDELNGKSPVVFQNVYGRLRMYYSLEKLKNSIGSKSHRK